MLFDKSAALKGSEVRVRHSREDRSRSPERRAQHERLIKGGYRPSPPQGESRAAHRVDGAVDVERDGRAASRLGDSKNRFWRMAVIGIDVSELVEGALPAAPIREELGAIGECPMKPAVPDGQELEITGTKPHALRGRSWGLRAPANQRSVDILHLDDGLDESADKGQDPAGREVLEISERDDSNLHASPTTAATLDADSESCPISSMNS
ncbi:MAG: hypothetical protein ACM3PF_06675 [Bacteroidota bacterium]